MNVLRVIATACVALAAASSTLIASADTTRAADVPDDLGVGAATQVARFDIALKNIALHCASGDQHILYYADGSQPQLFKVRTISELGAVLDAHLHHLRFDDWPRAYPGAATGPIAESPEVAHAMKTLGVSLAKADADIVSVPVPSGRYEPSQLVLPREMNDITVEQALDEVARAFHAIVTVAICDKPRLIEFEVSNAPLAPRGSASNPPPAGVDDLGVAATIRPDAIQKVMEYLGADCSDGRVIYYVDGSQPGLLEIRSRSDLAEVLDVRLRHLQLDFKARRRNMNTVYSIEHSPDFQRAAQRLGTALVGPLPYDAYAILPNGGVWIVSDLAVGGPPKLPSALDGTVEQALARSAAVFRDVVAVGECAKPRRLDMVFFWDPSMLTEAGS